MTLTDPRRARKVRSTRIPRRTAATTGQGLGPSRQQPRLPGAQAARRAKRAQAEAKHKRLSTPERISGYTDAVFAVVITIMVLELHPPASARIGALLGLWPTVVSYVVSYVFIAIIWINHHFLMGYVRQTTLRILWLNFMHLFFVSLLPFATAWIARTELAREPVVFYTALFVVTDGAYNLFESEVLRNSPDFSVAEYRAARRRSLIALALFATAVLLALIQPAAGLGFIGLALLLHLRPDVARRSQLRFRMRDKAAN
jgi:TMEM175 potassium channel family protein